MNFLPGSFDGTTGEAVLCRGRVRLRLDGELARGVVAAGRSGNLVFGIRPEHLHVDASGEAGATVDAVVEVVEPLGAETIVEVDLGGQSLTARLKGEHLPSVGSTLRLQVRPQSIYAFDSDSGQRLRSG